MYFVDRKAIDDKLFIMDQYLEFFNNKKEWTSFTDKLLLERIVHIVIESMVDVGNGIIDGFIMRDPGSYEDIIDILLDEKVIKAKDAVSFKKLISLRSMVVREYTKIDHKMLKEVLETNYNSLQHFSPSIKQYLKNELGHVTAFIPD